MVAIYNNPVATLWRKYGIYTTGLLFPSTRCSVLAQGFCSASVDGYCIGGHEDGTCYG